MTGLVLGPDEERVVLDPGPAEGGEESAESFQPIQSETLWWRPDAVKGTGAGRRFTDLGR